VGQTPTASGDPDPAPWDPARAEARQIAERLERETAWSEVARIARAVVERQDGTAADAAVVRALSGRLAEAPAEARGSILRALAISGSRDAVAAMMPLLAEEESAAGVMAALVDLTGRSDLGADAEAWREWWSRTEWIPEAEWLRRLARWQAERSWLMADEITALEQRLADAVRAQYARATDEERPALVLSSLRDRTPVLRGLGLELASRGVLDAATLPAEVFDAAADLLEDHQPRIRIAAAGLLAAAGVAEHADRIRAALRVEHDAGAAAAQMDALALMGVTGRDAGSAEDWLGHAGAQSAAARLLVRALSDRADDPALAPMARRVLDRIDPDAGRSLGPAGVMLFSMLAHGQRWREGLLAVVGDADADAAVRHTAAEALVVRPSGLDALADAGRDDPAVGRLAIAAAERVAPTAACWRALSGLESVTEEDREALASAMSEDEAATAAERESDAERRLLLLRRLKPAPDAAEPERESESAEEAPP